MPDKSVAQFGIEDELMAHQLAFTSATCADGEMEGRGCCFEIGLVVCRIRVQINLSWIIVSRGSRKYEVERITCMNSSSRRTVLVIF